MGWVTRRATDIVLVLAGAIALLVSVGLWFDQRPIEGGIITTGTIVEHVTRTDSDNSKSTYPVIEFTDRSERTHRFENKIGGSGFGAEGRIGQVVKVRYDPDDPSRAQWADQPGAWVSTATFGVGLLLWVIELVLVGRRWLRRRRTQIGDTEARQWPGDTAIETSS